MVLTEKIGGMEFSLLSPEIIKNMARVRVVVSDLYDPDGYPIEGGVMDPRLGVIDPGLHCRTCGGGIGECPGHFGYLELAKPITNILFIKMVYQILKITCRKCSRIMIEEGKKFDIGKGAMPVPAKCPHCKAKQKKISISKPYTFYEDKTELTPEDVREKFEKIPNKDLKKIGMSGGRPEWMIITLFPVPPVTMRPSITLEGGERSEDDLTHKLVDIVRINQSLKENIDIGAPEFILNDLWELVQYHISTYFDNELTGIPLARHRSGRALKGLIQRLKAKEGRIRGNLLGKRVNFSARTVISPDPMLSINEVGVPQEVASELTIPVYVTDINMPYIKQLFKDNKVNYIIRPDGRRIKMTKDNKSELLSSLTNDWIIERQLKDGDIVIFNRQPSLHRISMMAHRVRVLPYRTFRMNPSVCMPYNADFDGDEMNLHVPQNEEARTEASFLMEVEKNIISPKFGGPVIGLDLDQISGIYLLTCDNVVMNKKDAVQLFASAGIDDIDFPDKESFTGKDMVSLLFPDNFNIEYKSNSCKNCDICVKSDCVHGAYVNIKNGKMSKGVVDKKGVGAEKGKILNKLSKLLSQPELKDFIDNSGRLGVAYLMKRGFSIGVSDLDISPGVNKTIREEISRAKNESEALIRNFTSGDLKPLPGLTEKESLEAKILNVLAQGVSNVSEIIAENIGKNDIVNMFTSGAKGSIINTSQMAAVVGSETIQGNRVTRGYMKRTLPHYKPRDLSAEAHGFVSNGFKQGLSPFELFWNIMNGREGLMDKSLRTRKSGYMQRRLINALQDLMVAPDGSVRDSNGNIVQFIAGEDGIDPSKSDWGTLNWKEGLI